MKESQSTEFIHDGVMMSEYKRGPFIIGDYSHNRIEFFFLAYKIWFNAPSYPFQERLFGYASVSRPNKLFVFGGCCENNWSLISVYEDAGWSKHGYLNQGRMNFLAITFQTDIMIVGGLTKNQKP